MDIKEKEDVNKMVLAEIKRLISEAPDYWMTIVRKEMGNKKENTIRSYIRGDRGIKKGYHKDILIILQDLVAKYKQDTLKLLSNELPNL